MDLPIFQIPGNIKQQFLPFVLNPNNDIHQSLGASSTDIVKSSAYPQLFTYRKSTYMESDCAMLQLYPSSLRNEYINDDISFKLLYGNDPSNPKKSLQISDIMNSIPGVQIREYLPDTRLDQCINLFVDMFKSFGKIFDRDKGGKKEDQSSIWKKLGEALEFTLEYMIGIKQPSFFTDMFTNSSQMARALNSYKSSVYENMSSGSSPGFFVLSFPYLLYYRLQSCTTTNIYEIPCADTSKRIISSMGDKGWGDGSDILGAGGFRVSNALNKIPLIGNLANMILGNIGINYMPWWNAESGVKTVEPQVELKFDLFNDSAEAAMRNFIFVNTIVPNNRWLQYGMFQHSSNLYDVKIEGLNRLFACSASMNVTYEGVLRDPHVTWLHALKAHFNKNMDAEKFFQNLVNNKLIKIPDVYRVTMTFQSLLPANFNNFLYNFSSNESHIVNYGPGKPVYEGSELAKMLPKGLNGYVQRVVEVWNQSNSDAGFALKLKSETNTDKAQTKAALDSQNAVVQRS